VASEEICVTNVRGDSTEDRSHISRDFLQLGRRRRRLSVCVVAALVVMRSRRRFTKDSLTPNPPHHSRSRATCPKIVQCRWCPSARCEYHDAVNENRVADAVASRGSDRRARRARRALLQRLVAAVGAPVETTATARNVHVSIKSVVSSRLARLASWLSL
jgi:hypothetical protein